eukprot:scaffold678_cov146-Skeletonema_menzelii.AAC.19
MGKVKIQDEDEENQVTFTSEAGIDIRIRGGALPSPSVDNEPLAQQSGILSSSDSGEVVGAVRLADTVLASAALGCITHDEEDNDDLANNAGRGTKHSFLKSPTCSATLAVMMIASVAFLASVFIFHPNSGQGRSNANVNYVFKDGYNETNATQMEIGEDTLSIIMKDMIFSTSSVGMDDTISPSPTFSPTSLDSGSPSVSPSEYPIAVKADEDTFITTGETQKQGIKHFYFWG